jgi:hypothetical protein
MRQNVFLAFLNIASGDTQTLFAVLKSPPKGGGEGATAPSHYIHFKGFLSQVLACRVVFKLGEQKQVCGCEL